jgi:hypothetical protein
MNASDLEQLMKLHAIRCHATQLRLSKKRFLEYASRPEFFISWCADKAATLDDCFIRSITRRPTSLRLKLQIPIVSRTLLAPTLLFVGRDDSGELRSARLHLSPRLGELTVPLFSSVQPIFVKLKRRSLFFDRAGWVEVRADHSEPQLLDTAWAGEAAVASR